MRPKLWNGPNAMGEGLVRGLELTDSPFLSAHTADGVYAGVMDGKGEVKVQQEQYLGGFVCRPQSLVTPSELFWGKPFVDEFDVPINPPLGTDYGDDPQALIRTAYDSKTKRARAKYRVKRGQTDQYGHVDWQGKKPKRDVISWRAQSWNRMSWPVDGGVAPTKIYDFSAATNSVQRHWCQGISTSIYTKFTTITAPGTVQGAAYAVLNNNRKLVAITGSHTSVEFKYMDVDTGIWEPTVASYTAPTAYVAVQCWYFNRDGTKAACVYVNSYGTKVVELAITVNELGEVVGIFTELTDTVATATPATVQERTLSWSFSQTGDSHGVESPAGTYNAQLTNTQSATYTDLIPVVYGPVIAADYSVNAAEPDVLLARYRLMPTSRIAEAYNRTATTAYVYSSSTTIDSISANDSASWTSSIGNVASVWGPIDSLLAYQEAYRKEVVVGDTVLVTLRVEDAPVTSGTRTANKEVVAGETTADTATDSSTTIGTVGSQTMQQVFGLDLRWKSASTVMFIGAITTDTATKSLPGGSSTTSNTPAYAPWWHIGVGAYLTNESPYDIEPADSSGASDPEDPAESAPLLDLNTDESSTGGGTTQWQVVLTDLYYAFPGQSNSGIYQTRFAWSATYYGLGFVSAHFDSPETGGKIVWSKLTGVADAPAKLEFEQYSLPWFWRIGVV